MLRLVALLALICMASPAPLAAQATGMLRGTVRNEANADGMQDVLVRVNETGQETRTGLNGGFEFARVRPGTYLLTIHALGFAAFQTTIAVTAGEVSTADISLSARPIELDEVLASADRSFSAASSRTVRAFDLVVRPVRSAQDLLQLAPGLVTAQHAGGGKAEQIFLRGFDADHGTDVAIAVDGVPVNMVSHGHGQGYADMHFVIPDVIDRIDVNKGSYTTEWGNFAIAGAVSFTTRDHLDANMVRGEAGEFGTSNVTA
jgi:outer membrane receptor protein involved in Fe transport